MKPSGQNEYVALQTIVERQLQPVLETYKDRVKINGPEFLLNMVAAQQIALAVHELATNAIKYGALI
jgi:two-component system CheB/CheR fusion protein